MCIKTNLFLAVTSVLLLCVGCIYIPYPRHKVIHRAPDEQTLSSIKEGVTSKEDILMMLGEPDRVMEKEKFFQYWWQEEPGEVALLAPAYVPIQVRNTYLLHIYFDENNIVRKFEIKQKDSSYNPLASLPEPYAGNYLEMKAQTTSEIELEENGKGVWNTLGKKTPFKWSIYDNEIRMEIDSGTVIGQIKDDILEILHPADLKGRQFKRVKDSNIR